jgi:hypothetical protein
VYLKSDRNVREHQNGRANLLKIKDVQALPLSIPLKKTDPRSPKAQRFGKQVIVKLLGDEAMKMTDYFKNSIYL